MKILKDHITAFVILDGKVMQEKNVSMSMNASEIFIYAIHLLHLRVNNIVFTNNWASYVGSTLKDSPEQLAKH